MRITTIALCALLAGCTQDAPVQPTTATPAPPSGFVAVDEAVPPPPPGFTPVEAPSKDEYVADQDAVAAFNREQEAKSEARRAQEDAEWAADRRTDRVVEAQNATQQELKRVADKLD